MPEAPPLPDELAILRRGPAAFVLYTMLIGAGVCSSVCFGIGLVLMCLGSAGVLQHCLRGAGYRDATYSFYAGFLTLVLAVSMFAAGMLGLGVLGRSDPRSAIAGIACVAVMGAALAPLALAPIAAACGTKGFVAPVVRAIDLAGTDELHVLAPLCAVIAVALVAPMWIAVRAALDANFEIVAAALVFWSLVVPASAAVLTLRYLRLQQRNDAPSRISRAIIPVLAAAAIGLAAFGGSVAIWGATRVHIHGVSGGALVLALVSFALALAWLRRIGKSLRLLSAPRFELAGTLRVEGSDLTFASSDGAHLVRVPRPQLDHAKEEHALASSDAALLLSSEPLAPMDFRTAHAPCPPGALVVVGPREDALARRIVRARQVGFRLALLTLASLVTASIAVLLRA